MKDQYLRVAEFFANLVYVDIMVIKQFKYIAVETD